MNVVDVLDYIFPTGSIKLADHAKLVPDREYGTFTLDVVANQPLYSYNRLCQMRFSQECLQDMTIVYGSIFAIRTPPLEQKEITEWQEAANYLNQINLEKVYSKVEFENQEQPYAEFGCWDDESCAETV